MEDPKKIPTTGKYILGGPEGKTALPCNDLLEWADWFEGARTTVNRTIIPIYTDRMMFEDCYISTIFLGLDYSFGIGNAQKPLLFETMIFKGKHNSYQHRCSTWEQAEVMHQEAVDLVMKF